MMQNAILRIISKRADNVRICFLCGSCKGKTWASNGEAAAEEQPALVV